MIIVGISSTPKQENITETTILILILFHLLFLIPINFPVTKIGNLNKLEEIGYENNVIALNVPCVPLGYCLRTVHRKPTLDGLFTRAEKSQLAFFQTS